MTNEFGFGVDPKADSLVVRAEGGVSKVGAFFHKHSQGPAMPIVAATLGTIFFGPIGLLVGGGLGFGAAKATSAHMAKKAMDAVADTRGGLDSVPPTGYIHLGLAPAAEVQAQAAEFFKGNQKINATKKVSFNSVNYLFRIEKFPPAPERGMMEEHLGVMVYQKI